MFLFLPLFFSPFLSLKSIKKTNPPARDYTFGDRFLEYVTREVFLKRAEHLGTRDPEVSCSSVFCGKLASGATWRTCGLLLKTVLP